MKLFWTCTEHVARCVWIYSPKCIHLSYAIFRCNIFHNFSSTDGDSEVIHSFDISVFAIGEVKLYSYRRKYPRHSGADPGGTPGARTPLDPGFWGPNIEHIWALFHFSIIFFCLASFSILFLLICWFFIVQIQKFSSLASLSIWLLTQKSLFLILVSHILGY